MFYATKENNIAQFKIKVEINELLHCFIFFYEFSSNCFICVIFNFAVWSIIFKVQDQKHGRKDTGSHVRHSGSNITIGFEKLSVLWQSIFSCYCSFLFLV